MSFLEGILKRGGLANVFRGRARGEQRGGEKASPQVMVGFADVHLSLPVIRRSRLKAIV
jgi:hypothetical protein